MRSTLTSSPPHRSTTPPHHRPSTFAFQSQVLTVEQAYNTWNNLATAIKQILNGQASKLRFEELYRNSYNLVLHKHGQLLYNGVTELLTQHCQHICVQCIEYIGQHGETNDVLSYVQSQYDLHCLYMGLIRDILLYMDSAWSKSTPNTRPIYDAGILMFQNVVIRDSVVLNVIRRLLLHNISIERNNGTTDKMLIKSTINMLITCNINALTLYVTEFETYYLANTKQYYMERAQHSITHDTVSTYTNHVQDWTSTEEQRCTLYMHETSRAKLKALLCDILIIQYARQLISDSSSGIVYMYINDLYPELTTMYKLYQRAQCIDLIREHMSAYIKSMGAAILNSAATKHSSSNNSTSKSHQFIQQILSLRQKFTTIIDTSYSSDRVFHKALRDAFEQFINTDTRTALALSDHIDDLLKRSSKTMSLTDVDTELNSLISLFVYIHDKDIFELHYKQSLMQRLLSTNTVNNDIEKLMIGKLKAEQGYQFTSRLEGMFKDIELSRQVSADWATHCKEISGSDMPTAELYVNVLTTGFWPIQQSNAPVSQSEHVSTTSTSSTSTNASTTAVKLSSELQSIVQQFSAYYMNVHSGRRVSFQYQYGTAELRFNTVHGRKELLISTYQCIILTLFNYHQSYTYGEIQQLTGMPADELNRHILSLAHPSVKVLRKSPNTKTNDMDHVYTVNMQYSSALYRNKVPLLSRASVQPDAGNNGGDGDAAASSSVDTLANTAAIEEGRKHSVEASIVRIMKSRKTLEHSVLIAEVLKQCGNKFSVEPTFVKKRVESLIERDYIERDKDNRRVYHYLT